VVRVTRCRALTLLEEFQEGDSGWALSCILNLTVNANKYNPLHAGCYIKLSREIMMKRVVVNVQSMDNAWSVVAALHPAEKKSERKTSYLDYTTVLNLKNIVFPMTLNQIKKFENLNDISINVYCIEKQKELLILPIRLTVGSWSNVNLLTYTYKMIATWDISYGSRICLVSSQINRYGHKKFFCDRYVYLLKLRKYFNVFIFWFLIINFFANVYITLAQMKN